MVIDFDIIYQNSAPYISAVDLFDFINGNKKYYSDWVKLNITHQPQGLPKIGRDYLLRNAEIRHKPGVYRTDYLLSLDFAKELCYQTKTPNSDKCREWIYSLDLSELSKPKR
jgi:phage anti-repressor protein